MLFCLQIPEEHMVPTDNEHVPTKWVYTGKKRKRISLVLNCVFPHDYSSRSQEWINLQHYVIKEKKLSEREAIRIFYDVARVVVELHERNIVHRDLKLGNMAFNRRLRKISLVNLCLGKQLMNDDDLLKDQRGSPAYISPDVLSAKPYAGKPSDMWALGVVLFTMVYGQFPFYDSVPSQLFSKIKAADYTLPKEIKVSETTQTLITKLLVLNPKQRLTARQVVDILEASIAIHMTHPKYFAQLQVVPDLEQPQTLRFESRSARRARNTESHLNNLIFKRNTTVQDILNEPSTSVSSTGVSLTCSPYPLAASSIAELNSRSSSSSTTNIRSYPLRTLPITRTEQDGRYVSSQEMSQLRQLMLSQRIPTVQANGSVSRPPQQQPVVIPAHVLPPVASQRQPQNVTSHSANDRRLSS